MAKKNSAGKTKASKKSRVAGISYQQTPGPSAQKKDPTAPDHKVSVGFGGFAETGSDRAQRRREAPSRAGGGGSTSQAVATILGALEGLEPSQVEGVINEVVERYAAAIAGGGRVAAAAGPEPGPEPEPEPEPEPAPRAGGAAKGRGKADDARLGYDNLPAFVAGAGVKSPAMRSLLCAYWMQLVEGAEEFLPEDLERELALMQMPIRDIDEVFDSLTGKGYVTEIPSQRSTKRYMLTPQGVNAVWELFE